MNKKEISFTVVVIGLFVYGFFLAVVWPSERRAERRAAEKQDRLADEVDVDTYERVELLRKRPKTSQVPGLNKAIKDAMQDGKMTYGEYNPIDKMVYEYDKVKSKYEAIKALQSDLTSQGDNHE